MLIAQGLCKRYPGATQDAVKQLDVTIAKGEIFGLLGPNGAGKTTTIAMLSTILHPDSGSITIDNVDALTHTARAKTCIGLVPQTIALYPELTAWENLAFFGRLQGIHGRGLKQSIQEALTNVGLETKAHQKIAAFSGGMQRRANLAAGLLHGPKMLFLDEPTVGVDIQSRQLILDRLQDIQSAGTTILYTTHYMEEAQQICNRVAIMDDGRILQEGPPDNLMDAVPGCNNLGDLFLHLTGKQLRD